MPNEKLRVFRIGNRDCRNRIKTQQCSVSLASCQLMRYLRSFGVQLATWRFTAGVIIYGDNYCIVVYLVLK